MLTAELQFSLHFYFPHFLLLHFALTKFSLRVLCCAVQCPLNCSPGLLNCSTALHFHLLGRQWTVVAVLEFPFALHSPSLPLSLSSSVALSLCTFHK